MTLTLVWFRHDLRIDDNPALAEAAARGAVLPVFIWAPEEEGDWPPGAASRWWLHHSLEALAAALGRLGAPLVVRRGPTLQALRSLLRETGAGAIYWNRRYEPAIVARDAGIKRALREEGVEVDSFNAALLREPWSIATGTGSPYKVFTPYWKASLAAGEPATPFDPPQRLNAPKGTLRGVAIGELELRPTIDWAGGLREAWAPGERGAQEALRTFLSGAVAEYAAGRDLPGEPLTSRLSPHLHFGEVSPRRIWHECAAARGRTRAPDAGASIDKFLAEVGWREFAHQLIFHFPATVTEPLRSEFASFPWRSDPADLRAWQRGATGYPLVDAGMRELWHTGWMHNRVRMVVASFLVKHLLLPWQEGARWFWETLVDADLASNTLGWQWTAGCGADAAPYFRIFNPVAQGAKFDADGRYVRRWVPELAALSNRHLHAPWEAPEGELRAAGVRLGSTYPRPLVDHAMARARALDALATISAEKTELARRRDG
ncbi:MAG TPA: deoxyribodipyrimidine photo-lyase [Phycisphaerales bacterium]|nr:deoxyribodipyrimidine photo-lyase [Phycisphaerales bacterium]HMP36536.1 deoxyribodipyrimidine photo-lyase [Phycisphaerales bacterium]